MTSGTMEEGTGCCSEKLATAYQTVSVSVLPWKHPSHFSIQLAQIPFQTVKPEGSHSSTDKA